MGGTLRRLSLTFWIFAGMAAGVAVGVAAPGFASHLEPVSHIFLRLIRSIIAPLLFATLVHGIAGSGDIKQMGRIGLKAILYFEIVTTLALFLGLGAVNLVRPARAYRSRGPPLMPPFQPRRPGSNWRMFFPPVLSTRWRETTLCK
jgi:proton glutamate symport protein